MKEWGGTVETVQECFWCLMTTTSPVLMYWWVLDHGIRFGDESNCSIKGHAFSFLCASYGLLSLPHWSMRSSFCDESNCSIKGHAVSFLYASYGLGPQQHYHTGAWDLLSVMTRSRGSLFPVYVIWSIAHSITKTPEHEISILWWI